MLTDEQLIEICRKRHFLAEDHDLHYLRAIADAARRDAQENMVRTDKLITTLAKHWMMGVECNHEKGTDRASCYCTVWRGSEMADVGAAVDEWILHVIEEMNK